MRIWARHLALGGAILARPGACPYCGRGRDGSHMACKREALRLGVVEMTVGEEQYAVAQDALGWWLPRLVRDYAERTGEEPTVRVIEAVTGYPARLGGPAVRPLADRVLRKAASVKGGIEQWPRIA